MNGGVTYGSVPLIDPGAEVRAWIEASLSTADIYGTVSAWPGPRNPSRWPFPPRRNLRPIRLGSLWWPRDAQQHAVYHGLCCDDDLKVIRAAAYLGGSYRPLPLILDDGSGTGPVTTSLYMLPPRPLAQCPGREAQARDLFLLRLVDVRYFWPERAADIAITPGVTTYAALFAAIATGLGITLTVDTISAAYLTPPAELTAHYESLPHLLDAACQQVGHRFVRLLNGTCRTQTATTAAVSLAAQETRWPKVAGGVIPAADLPTLPPASVLVAFPTNRDGLEDGTYYPVTAAVPNGHSGTRTFHDAQRATYVGGVLTNTAALAALTTQVATDLAGWLRIARQDQKYAGVIPYTPEGTSESIEWILREGEASTRVQGGQWFERVSPELQSVGAVVPVVTPPPNATVSYAGVTLTPVTAAWLNFVASSVQPSDVWEFRGIGCQGVVCLPKAAVRPPLRLGELYWPQSASRWATGHFLATDTQLTSIRAAVHTDGTLTYGALVLTDGATAAAVTAAKMYLLPPRPLQTTGGVTTYLLTLVDWRYYAWGVEADVGDYDNWGDILLNQFVNMGTTYTPLPNTVTQASVNVKYLNPPRYLNQTYSHLPMLVDAICASTGQRLVANLNGTVETQLPGAARTAQLAQEAAVTAAKVSGDFFALDYTTTNDLATVAPQYVAVLYPAVSNGLPLVSMDVAQAEQLDRITPQTLPAVAAAYGSTFRGTPGAAVIRTSGVYTGTNVMEHDDLREQIATDFYLWRLSNPTVVYAGVVAWTPGGMDDSVEWRVRAGEVTTRVFRPPWDGEACCLHHQTTVSLSSVKWGGTGPAYDAEPVAHLGRCWFMSWQGLSPLPVVSDGSAYGTPGWATPDSSWGQYASSSDLNLLTDPGGGQLLWVQNTSGVGVKVENMAAPGGATAGALAAQIATPTGQDMHIAPYGAIGLLYDSENTVWQVITPTLDVYGSANVYGVWKQTFSGSGAAVVTVTDSGNGRAAINVDVTLPPPPPPPPPFTYLADVDVFCDPTTGQIVVDKTFDTYTFP